MATYRELYDRFFAGGLRSRVMVAACIKAHVILQEPSPSAGRKSWAAALFSQPEDESLRLLRYILAANKDLTPAAIDGATDVAIQTKVDEAVDILYP